jgi:hypothetical protein
MAVSMALPSINANTYTAECAASAGKQSNVSILTTGLG